MIYKFNGKISGSLQIYSNSYIISNPFLSWNVSKKKYPPKKAKGYGYNRNSNLLRSITNIKMDVTKLEVAAP